MKDSLSDTAVEWILYGHSPLARATKDERLISAAMRETFHKTIHDRKRFQQDMNALSNPLRVGPFIENL